MKTNSIAGRILRDVLAAAAVGLARLAITAAYDKLVKQSRAKSAPSPAKNPEPTGEEVVGSRHLDIALQNIRAGHWGAWHLQTLLEAKHHPDLGARIRLLEPFIINHLQARSTLAQYTVFTEDLYNALTADDDTEVLYMVERLKAAA